MILIDEIYTDLEFLINQGQSRYFSPEEKVEAINDASFDLFRQEEKKFEETQIITDTLRYFKIRQTFTVQPGGAYALPANYIRSTAINYNVDTVTVTPIIPAITATFCDPDYVEPVDPNALADKEKEIPIVTDSEWANRLDSRALPVTEQYPICRIYEGSFQVVPETVVPILYYLRKPVKAVWNYTISGDGSTPIYNAIGSVDLDWPEISKNEVLEKAMSILGVVLRDGAISTYEQAQKRNNNE
jgi:hypothetical protein